MARSPAIHKALTITLALTATILVIAPYPVRADTGPDVDTMQIATYEQAATLQLYQRFIKEAYLRLGISIRYTALPPLRATHSTNGGELDALLLASKFVETGADNIVRVTEALPRMDFRVVANSHLPATTLPSDLGTYSVGYLRGINPLERQFDDKQQKLTVNGNFETLIQLLKLERVDLVVMPDLDARILIRQHPGLKMLRKPVYTFSVFHYVYQDLESLAGPLGGMFRKLKRDRACMNRITQAVLGRDAGVNPDHMLAVVNAAGYVPLCPADPD